jgi:predicted AlkP superfamily pyrophosphatase or phosphodiesterase
VVLKELGLIATEGDKVTSRKAWCVPQGGSAFVYVLDDARRSQVAAQLKDRFANLDGVTGVVTPDGFAKLGLPPPSASSESPDLVLLTGPGYSFADVVQGDAVGSAGGLKGTHGHDPAPAYMHATFVAAGAGIKPGTQLDIIQNVDVAPTIARLMGLAMKNVDGRVLSEILAE